MTDHYICPGCGDEVRVGSKGCPKCNHLDPWEIEENESYDGIDLPDDEFNYDEFIKREFGGGIPKKGKALFWWIVAVIVLVAFVWIIVF